MYGLTMMKDYLMEILNGEKTYDARAYITNKRGTIALIDSRSLKVFGYADIVGVREISSQEYGGWHCTGKYSRLTFETDDTRKYYAWDLENIRKEDNPFKVVGEKKTWMRIENYNTIKQLKLF